jgi:protocatechuate 3,4-dioxygenase beta subunit
MSRDRDRLTYTPNRREVLIKGIAGAFAVAGTWSSTGTVFASVPGVSHGETPGLTEGPYWVDGQAHRIDVRYTTSTGVYTPGVPLLLSLGVSRLSDTAPYTITPLAGARVDIWCANAQGVYSDVTQQNTVGQDFLRGYQVTNAQGLVQFLTVYPGWYSGRTPHIHVRVRTYTAAGAVSYNFASQFFFNDVLSNRIYSAATAYHRPAARDTTNASDGIFAGASNNGSPATEAGDFCLLAMGTNGNYLVGQQHLILDLQDTNNADPTNGVEGGFGP